MKEITLKSCKVARNFECPMYHIGHSVCVCLLEVSEAKNYCRTKDYTNSPREGIDFPLPCGEYIFYVDFD